jgi:hypothetical protein
MIFLKFKFLFVLCFYGALFSMNPGFGDHRFKLSNIPTNYRDTLSLNVYIFCKTGDQKEATPAIMQLVKHVFKGTSLTWSFPNDVIYKILNYSVKKDCLIGLKHQIVYNFKALKKNALLSVLNAPIVDFSMRAYIRSSRRQMSRAVGNSIDKISSFEPDNAGLYSSDIAIRITTTQPEVSDNDIKSLKESGLIFFDGTPTFLEQEVFDAKFRWTNEKQKLHDQAAGKTTFSFSQVDRNEAGYSEKKCFDYNFYKTFNAHPKYSLSFKNRSADYNHFGQEHGPKNTSPCVLTVFDRETNKEFDGFEFDDYIENCFCCGNLLIVELMQKTILATGYSTQIQFCSNHRVGIYNLKTKELINLLPLALSKKTGNGKTVCPLYELAYVDNEKIYLRILENGAIISMNYYHQSRKYSSDEFFVDDVEPVSNAKPIPDFENPVEKSVLPAPGLERPIPLFSRIKNYLIRLFISYLNYYLSLNQSYDIILKLIVKD